MRDRHGTSQYSWRRLTATTLGAPQRQGNCRLKTRQELTTPPYDKHAYRRQKSGGDEPEGVKNSRRLVPSRTFSGRTDCGSCNSLTQFLAEEIFATTSSLTELPLRAPNNLQFVGALGGLGGISIRISISVEEVSVLPLVLRRAIASRQIHRPRFLMEALNGNVIWKICAYKALQCAFKSARTHLKNWRTT